MRTGFFSGEDCWLLHESTVLWLRDSYSIRVRKKRKVFLCRCFEPAGMSGLEKNILGFVPCLKTRPGNCFQRLISPALDATGSMTVRCNAMNPCGHLGNRTLRMLSKAISAGFNLPPVAAVPKVLRTAFASAATKEALMPIGAVPFAGRYARSAPTRR